MIRKAIFLIGLAVVPIYGGEIQWGAVESGRNITVLRVPGKIIPKEGALSVESARLQGRVTNILKREGEAVAVGDPLFRINSAECVSLFEEKRVAEERGLQDLIAGAAARQEQLGLRVDGGQCSILATHASTIVKRQVELGAAFNIGDALATVLDVDLNLNVELDLPAAGSSRRDQAAAEGEGCNFPSYIRGPPSRGRVGKDSSVNRPPDADLQGSASRMSGSRKGSLWTRWFSRKSA